MGKANQQRTAPVPAFPRTIYGPDSLNYMTVWLAESSQPSPVVLLFYAGGFRVGDGRRLSPQDKPAGAAPIDEVDLPVLRAKQDILRLLSSGISILCNEQAHLQGVVIIDAPRGTSRTL